LTQNAPLHIVDGCESWNALKSWKDQQYLATQFGQRLMQPMEIYSRDRVPASPGFTYNYDKFFFDSRNARPMSKSMNMQSFLQEKNSVKDKVLADQSVPGSAKEDKSKRPDEMKLIYLDNAMSSIKQNPMLMKDIQQPQFLS